VSRPPARCAGCQQRPVAWTRPRVDYCYQCLPGGPFTPPPCRHCGSTDYFSAGLCSACHPGGPLHMAACRDCVAWGVSRQHNWHCWRCRWWRTHYPIGPCRYCGREMPTGELGSCRLCMEQARMRQEPGRAIDLADATRFGHQLFLANFSGQRRRTQQLATLPRRAPPPEPSVPWRQDALFEVTPDAELVKQRALNADGELALYCKNIVTDHARKHGWSTRQTNQVVLSLRVLQILQDTERSPIKASEVIRLRKYDGTVNSTLEVLEAAGLLIEDRETRIERYFNNKTAELPEPMKQQLQIWLNIMISGSTNAPRRLPRLPQTAQIKLASMVPIVRSWSEQGITSLAEITPALFRASLPASGPPRVLAEQALRSVFGILKAQKLIFINPTRGMKVTVANKNVPLPLDTDLIRAALDSPHPAVALAVALVAFHALTNKQLRNLQLTDIVDGRLILDERSIPLSAPVRMRLAAWLEHRQRTWPGTLNQHLLITRKTAPRLAPAGQHFPWNQLPFTSQALREDRILQEIHATGGDVRRICDLFGMSIDGAMRYSLVLGTDDRPRPHVPAPRTRTIK
jgi:hypothetical protein